MPKNYTQPISINADSHELHGILTYPTNTRGVVLFAHGSGSSHLSPRNQFVATELNNDGLATLLFDLLTTDEEVNRRLVFDIDFLTDRLLIATKWTKKHPKLLNLPIGYFGASTGAAAALQATARSPEQIFAVVSRGGRPDLAKDYLPRIEAPTLLIVGGEDTEVITLNEIAYTALRCAKELAIIPGATHLFEEPGTLEQVAEKAKQWFTDKLPHHE